MGQYVIRYEQTGTNELREQHRAEHIGYRRALGNRLVLAGPLLDDQGTANGSLIIVEAESRDAATRLAQNDPYVAIGVLSVVSLQAMRVAYMKDPAGTARGNA